MVKDPATLEATLSANSNADLLQIYAGSKFVQLLGAQWWRRQLTDRVTVVAVSPGMIHGTGLVSRLPLLSKSAFDSVFQGRHSGMNIPKDAPDAKSVVEGT